MKEGDRAPELRFTDLDGLQLRLASFGDTPTVLTFLRYIG